MRQMVLIAAAGALLSAAAPSLAQSAGAGSQELYHVHLVKAAMGKLPDLLSAYAAAPVPAGEQKPIVLRHREGDDWDLLVLTPFGKADHIVTATVSPDLQALYTKFRALSERHTDSFAAGPAWADAQKVFGSDASGVYVVGIYRAANGHRDQMVEALGKIATSGPAGRTLTLHHVEGGPFDVIQITRYDTWNDIDAQSAGQATPMAQSLDLRQHMAEHHDTICVRASK